MIRFHTCLILIKDIEQVVIDATNMWKNIYHLHKPSKDDPVEIIDDDSSNNDEFENTSSILVSPEELHELIKDKREEDKVKEAEEENKEEDDPVKIAAAVIASLPHSPPKMVTSTKEMASTEIMSTTASSIALSSPMSFQIQISTMQVSTISSIEL